MTLAKVRELTVWANMRLMAYDSSCHNILTEITEGKRMKHLLEALTGSSPKRLGSLDGLSLSQKISRVDWFIDTLKKENILSAGIGVDSKYFARNSSDHIFPVLWEMIVLDVKMLWQIAPNFQRRPLKKTTLLCEPLKAGPCIIRNDSAQITPFYTDGIGKPLTIYSVKRAKNLSLLDPGDAIMSLVNNQIKLIPEGKRLSFDSFSDLTNSRILCALVNSFVPGTFTSEILLNDRWNINLAVSTLASLFGVDCPVTVLELNKGDDIGSIGFLTYVLLSGFQFIQAREVVKRMNELQKNIKNTELQIKLKEEKRKREFDEMSIIEQHKALQAAKLTKGEQSEDEKALKRMQKELTWLGDTYCVEVCQQWLGKVKEVQENVKNAMLKQMKSRFDILTIPDNTGSISINDLCQAHVINLALTGGNGFYSNDAKESLWNTRRMVVKNKETGDVYEDFSGAICPKGSIRAMLGLHATDNVEISSFTFPDYELFFESPSRNKVLQSGDRFMYQVFPGTPKQSERVLRSATKAGDLETVDKLIKFYSSDEEFVNIPDPETGNTPLHLASRNGHFDIALCLLENGALVNSLNKSGCTPFFVAVEGLHRKVCELLIEWGGNVNIKNNVSKTAFEVIRNPELKEVLEKKNKAFSELTEKLRKHDGHYLEQFVESLLTGNDKMANLCSRSLDGCALLHWAAILGLPSVTQRLLQHHVDPNLRSSKDQTSLHLTQNIEVMQILISEGGDVNQLDHNGGTPAHAVCQTANNKRIPQAGQLLSILISSEADLTLVNNKGYTPIHYAVINGRTDVLEAMVRSSAEDVVMEILREEESNVPLDKRYLYLALTNGHIECAYWLAARGTTLTDDEVEKTAFTLLAETSKNPEIVAQFRFLFASGLNPNAVQNKDNQSLLHCAAVSREFPELTDLLVANGADVSFQDNSQRNPLFFACMSDNFHAARTLLENGADPSSSDVHGKTAFDYIKDYDEWMYSGYFYQDTIARLKAYSLKHSRLLVRSLTQKLKGVSVENPHVSLFD